VALARCITGATCVLLLLTAWEAVVLIAGGA
jgi:hypothetical protein